MLLFAMGIQTFAQHEGKRIQIPNKVGRPQRHYGEERNNGNCQNHHIKSTFQGSYNPQQDKCSFTLDGYSISFYQTKSKFNRYHGAIPPRSFVITINFVISI